MLTSHAIFESFDVHFSDLVVALSTDRGEFILDKFDVLYSAIVHFSSLKVADREQIWETVNKGIIFLCTFYLHCGSTTSTLF